MTRKYEIIGMWTLTKFLWCYTILKFKRKEIFMLFIIRWLSDYQLDFVHYLLIGNAFKFVVSLRVVMVVVYNNFQAPAFLSSIISKREDARSAGMNSLRAFALLGAGISGFLSFATVASADEAEHGLECPNYPWPHKGILSSYDHAA